MKTPLHKAIENNNIELVTKLVTKKAYINAKDKNGCTPVHVAVYSENVKALKVLVDANANVNAKNRLRRSPLYTSVELENVEIIKLLLAAGANVNTKEDLYFGNYKTLLHMSIASENANILKLLIEAGANVNIADSSGETPLRSAASGSELDIIKLLIDADADINKADNDGCTPLHEAVSMENEKIVKLLVEAGAFVNVLCYHFGYSPMHELAHNTPNAKILEILLEAGADVNLKNKEGCTPLHLAADEWNLNIFKLLFAAGANVNEISEAGDTPLVTLIESLYFNQEIGEVVELFIESTDVNLKTESGNILKNILVSENYSLERQHFYDVVLKHIAKLKALNLQVDPSLIDAISQSSEYNDYFTKCTQELKYAKINKLHNCWVTFFDLLNCDERKIVKFAGNDDLVEDFVNNVDKFPIYGSNMLSNTSKGINGRKLFDRATNVLSYFWPILNPTHLIINDTLEVLSEIDWKKLCE